MSFYSESVGRVLFLCRLVSDLQLFALPFVLARTGLLPGLDVFQRGEETCLVCAEECLTLSMNA